MHTVFALLCFVVVIHWLIFPYPSGLLDWHCGNLAIAPMPAKQPWWIWINTSCEFIMNYCITTTKQSTTKPCTYLLGYTVQSSDVITQPVFLKILTILVEDHSITVIGTDVMVKPPLSSPLLSSLYIGTSYTTQNSHWWPLNVNIEMHLNFLKQMTNGCSSETRHPCKHVLNSVT